MLEVVAAVADGTISLRASVFWYSILEDVTLQGEAVDVLLPLLAILVAIKVSIAAVVVAVLLIVWVLETVFCCVVRLLADIASRSVLVALLTSVVSLSI